MPAYGCVADDFTGATDIAGILVNGGLRVAVLLDLRQDTEVSQFDAVVVALKSRNVAPEIAVRDSVEAIRWLKNKGCQRFHFKYCSTFDSRPSGNIGPVIDALMLELDAPFTVVCPAFPANGRTVYQGNLFVWEKPLAESSMRHHPLTPMKDSNLLRLLGPQTERRLALVPYRVVEGGPDTIRAALQTLHQQGVAIAVVDAINEANLRDIAAGANHLTLTTGASGMASGVAPVLLESGLVCLRNKVWRIPRFEGREIILSGSCSAVTLNQVADAQDRMPVFRLDALKLAGSKTALLDVLQWVDAHPFDQRLLLSASAPPEVVHEAQEVLGVDKAGEIVETAFAEIAAELVRRGFRKFIVAGGETSGAVVKSLNIRSLQIGQQIDPGVNWTLGDAKPGVVLALKSGNFGSIDFFTRAWELL